MIVPKIWDICEDCGSTDIQFIRDDSAGALMYGKSHLTIAACRSCGESWEDYYDGMWLS